MSHRFVARSSLGDFYGCGARARGSPPSAVRGAGLDTGEVSSGSAPAQHHTGGSSSGGAPAVHPRSSSSKRVRRDTPGSGSTHPLGACSLEDSAARIKRSLLASKAISRFARYPDRRPSGLISADDGSLDIRELWLHWGRRMQLTRQQLLQSITEHTVGNRGRRRFFLRSDEDGLTWVSVSGSGSQPPPTTPSRFTSWAAPPHDVDSVASVHEAFLVEAVTVDGSASDVKLDPAVKLESDTEHEGSKPLSNAVESPLVSRSPVLWLPSFSGFFPSVLQRPLISAARLWVPPDQQDGVSPPFATQLDLDLDERALPVSASVADTPVGEDLVDQPQSVSTSAADALEGVFPVHSGPLKATSTQFDSVDVSP